MSDETVKGRIMLTGDRPTGMLHIGHYIGSLKHRVELQHAYESFLIIADLHTLTTRTAPKEISSINSSVTEMVRDYLAVGIDPKKTNIFLQSLVHSIPYIHLLLGMMVRVAYLQQIPSIKEMTRNANIDNDDISYGLLGYGILQSADILACKADLVPVGKDNEAHLELTRNIARKINNNYGNIFPIPSAFEKDIEVFETLIGTDGKGKMSKSSGNTIYLSEEQSSLRKKIMGMYTDPNRTSSKVPGRVDGNPVFIYHDYFNQNKSEIEDLKERYKMGSVGDVEVKEKLFIALDSFIAPIREERKKYTDQDVWNIILEGTAQMKGVANETLKELMQIMGFNHELQIKDILNL